MRQRPASAPIRQRPTSALVAVTMGLVLIVAAACSSDTDDGSDAESSSTASTTPDSTGSAGVAQVPVVLSGQGNNLDAYSVGTNSEVSIQRVITTADEDPDGLDINAQLCIFEQDGKRMLVAGEDTGQPDPPAGWGIFELTGDAVGDLAATEVAKLTPTFQQGTDQPENYGCGVLEDGRILTTDVGDQVTGADGQLIIWFPPFEGYAEGDIAYCKIDVALPTAQSILVTGPEKFLVAASRGGIFEYSGPLPTDDTPAGGCDSTDATGRGLATGVSKTTLVEPGPNGMATPAGLAPAPDDGFYASSVFSGVINSYDADGTLRETVLAPPEGETVGAEPYSTGTPLGLAADSEGNLWYADIGLVISDDGVGPGDSTGTVRMISFIDGKPSEPEVIAKDLAFPDGLGTFTPN